MPPAPPTRPLKRDKQTLREKFSAIHVLIADRDVRTGALVQRVLAAFGFTNAEIVASGRSALDRLDDDPFDIIITEWSMHPLSGIDLIRTIRTEKKAKHTRKDMPIIMLSGRAERKLVEEARDAGVNEFLVKPFSARTISSRLIQVIDNPRSFVEAGWYAGPCRRRREALPLGTSDRRGRGKHKATILPPDTSLAERIGTRASDLMAEMQILRAQDELLQSESDFLSWARDDIAELERAFLDITRNARDATAHARLLGAAYAIKSQAGIFGYDLGTEVAKMLVDYLIANTWLDADKLMVVRKHIDAIQVIFRQNIKEYGQVVGRELLGALQTLIQKIG